MILPNSIVVRCSLLRRRTTAMSLSSKIRIAENDALVLPKVSGRDGRRRANYPHG